MNYHKVKERLWNILLSLNLDGAMVCTLGWNERGLELDSQFPMKY